MPRHDERGIERGEAIERADPFARVAAERIGDRMVDEVAGDEDALGRQPGDDVAAGVAAAEVLEFDDAAAEVDAQR